MKAIILTLLIAGGGAIAAEKKAGTKPKPKPKLTVGELAVVEARKCDRNNDGRISGTEVSELRMAWSRNKKGYLYLYDDNGDNWLDDHEIAKIRFKPLPKAKRK